MSAPDTTEQSSQSSQSSAEASTTTETPTPTEATPTTPACEDGSPTPIGTCLHPASVQWLPDLLPDPLEVDRTNLEEVAITYVITRNVWDASRDRTDAYASIRASVYETPERANNHTPTPDLERGQGEFPPLLANQAHTSVTITDTNTNAPQPNTDPNRWPGNIYYLRTYSDGSLEPLKGREVVSLQLQDDGTWAVDNSGPYSKNRHTLSSSQSRNTPHNKFVRHSLTEIVFRTVAGTMHNMVHLTAVEASPTPNDDATHSGPTRRAHPASRPQPQHL